LRRVKILSGEGEEREREKKGKRRERREEKRREKKRKVEKRKCKKCIVSLSVFMELFTCFNKIVKYG